MDVDLQDGNKTGTEDPAGTVYNIDAGDATEDGDEDAFSSIYESSKESSVLSSEDAEKYMDVKGVMDLKSWFYIKSQLVDTLADEFWMEWEDEAKQEISAKQVEACEDDDSEWVLYETPRWQNDFKLLYPISHKSRNTSIDCVQHLQSGTKLIKRSIFKTKVKPEIRHRFFKKMRQEIGLICIASEFPCMTTAYSVYEDLRAVHMIMEFKAGGDLEDKVLDSKFSSEYDLWRIFVGICQCVYPFHEVNHSLNCLSLSRVLLVNAGAGKAKEDTHPVVLTDIGIIRNFGAESRPPSSKNFQNYFYIPPERYMGNMQKVGDVWSLGVMLFMMKFRYPPFFSLARNLSQYKNEMRDIICKGFIPEVREGGGPWFPAGQPCSSEFKNLITRMLEKDLRKRIALSEVFEHPWVLQYYDKDTMTYYLIKDLKVLYDAPYFIQEMISIVGDIFIPTEVVDMYYKQYATLDVDGNGLIDKDEADFKEAILDVFAGEVDEEMYEDMVLKLGDGNGAFSIKELMLGKMLGQARHRTDILKKLFNDMDEDGDGNLTEKEFVNALTKFCGDKSIEGKDLVKIGKDFSKHCNGNFKDFLHQLLNLSNETHDHEKMFGKKDK